MIYFMRKITLLIGLIILISACAENPDQPIQSDVIDLPEHITDSDTSVEEALSARRSVRSFSNEAMSISEIGQILWAAQGITSHDGKRTAPSAGPTYPLEVYVSVRNVKDLDPGVYHYLPEKHRLERIYSGDFSDNLKSMAYSQQHIKDAAAVLIMTAVFERTEKVFGTDAEKYVYMEAGHAAQNVYLQCESLDVGTVVVGSFESDRIKTTFALDGDPLYLIPLGK